MLQEWKARRAEKAQDRLMENTLSESFDRPSQRHIRKWEDRELHAKLASNELWPAELSMAERELERRKAWEQPSGWAFWLSVVAIGISAVALLKSFFG